MLPEIKPPSPEVRDQCRRIAAIRYYQAHLSAPERLKQLADYHHMLLLELQELPGAELLQPDWLPQS